MLHTVWRASEDVEVKLHACKGFRVILCLLMKTGISITPTENQIRSFLSASSYCTVFGTRPAVTVTDDVQ
jgi:hypothetical protein